MNRNAYTPAVTTRGTAAIHSKFIGEQNVPDVGLPRDVGGKMTIERARSDRRGYAAGVRIGSRHFVEGALWHSSTVKAETEGRGRRAGRRASVPIFRGG